MSLSSVSGTVIRGRGKAGRMATPTLNLPLRCVPKKLVHGVYAAEAKTPLGTFHAVVYFGPRFESPKTRVFEVHCFGLKENLVGTSIDVTLLHYLRPPKKFANVAALKKQIAEDINSVKGIFK